MGRKRKARRIAGKIRDCVDEIRRQHGEAPLREMDSLNSQAESYAHSMARAGKIGHRVDGTSPQRRYPGRGICENAWMTDNINRHPTTIGENAVNWWMNSNGHRQNILRSSSSYHGVGVWIADGNAYVAHAFARRPSPLAQPSAIQTLLGAPVRVAEIVVQTLRSISWLRAPYFPLRLINDQWWRILPRYRQNSLSVGIIIGFVIGVLSTNSTIQAAAVDTLSQLPVPTPAQAILGSGMLAGVYLLLKSRE